MAQTPENQPSSAPIVETKDRGIAIIATPTDDEKVLFRRTPEGGVTIKITGEIQIGLSPKVAQASEAVLTDTTGVTYGLIPEGTPPPASEDSKPAENGSGSESASGSKESKDGIFVPESENTKHEFVGNPVYDAKYRERKSGKRIADFHIATHPKENETHYYRIRAFDGLAEKVRDNVKKGQKNVQVVAYGPKYWIGKKRSEKSENGWKEELIEGYYAGFVSTPKPHKKEQASRSEPDPTSGSKTEQEASSGQPQEK